jgi:hypothetical protein
MPLRPQFYLATSPPRHLTTVYPLICTFECRFPYAK